VSSQDDVIRDLQAKVSQLETEKLKTENQLMMHKIELLAMQTDRQTDEGECKVTMLQISHIKDQLKCLYSMSMHCA